MKIIFSLIAASALLISASSANAEQICAPRDRAVKQLEKQFGEKVFGRGLAANGKRMIELFVSAGIFTNYFDYIAGTAIESPAMNATGDALRA